MFSSSHGALTLRPQRTVLWSKPTRIPRWWFPLWVQCQDQRPEQGRSILSQTSHITLIFHGWSIAKAPMHPCGSHNDRDEARRQLSCRTVSNIDRQCMGEKTIGRSETSIQLVGGWGGGWERQDEDELRLHCVHSINLCLWTRGIRPALVSAVTYQLQQKIQHGSRTESS